MSHFKTGRPKFKLCTQEVYYYFFTIYSSITDSLSPQNLHQEMQDSLEGKEGEEPATKKVRVATPEPSTGTRRIATPLAAKSSECAVLFDSSCDSVGNISQTARQRWKR